MKYSIHVISWIAFTLSIIWCIKTDFDWEPIIVLSSSIAGVLTTFDKNFLNIHENSSSSKNSERLQFLYRKKDVLESTRAEAFKRLAEVDSITINPLLIHERLIKSNKLCDFVWLNAFQGCQHYLSEERVLNLGQLYKQIDEIDIDSLLSTNIDHSIPEVLKLEKRVKIFGGKLQSAIQNELTESVREIEALTN